MRNISLTCLTAALVSSIAACSTPSTPALDGAVKSQLDANKQSPQAAGELIYEGAVFPLQPSSAPQLYRYERRLKTIPEGLSSSHITRDAAGEVIVVESAQFTPTYEVLGFQAINKQAGYSGTAVVIDGRRIEYALNEGGKITTQSEHVTDPVVTGPSLHGYILQHWDELSSGKTMPVRLIVMAKKETYGFDIQHRGVANGRTSFSITPSSFLVRLAVAPLTVEFDSGTRNVLRYQGRVPPMQQVNGKFAALDARVDYTMKVPVYR